MRLVGDFAKGGGFFVFAVAVATMTGCSAAKVVLKAPIDDRCSATGLRGCPDITDGMLLYVEGDKAGAVRKLLVGAAQNSPADLQKLAKALDDLKTLPGAESYVAALDEAVSLMVEQAGPITPSQSNSAPQKSNQEEQETPDSLDQPLRTVVTADTDPRQVTTVVASGVHSGPKIGWCADLAGEPAACRGTARGPLFLTDVESLGRQCEGQFVAVTRGREARFVLDGPFQIHGARIFLGPGEVLVVGQRERRAAPAPPEKSEGRTGKPAPVPQSQDAILLEKSDPQYECKLLWSGFVPYAKEQAEELRE